jgi:hypothetical protein
MHEFSLNIEHSSDATFDQHWSRIVYLISSNLFVEMGVILCIIQLLYFAYIMVLLDIRITP